MLPLKCAYQNYAWGKVGEDSKVYHFLKQSGQYSFNETDAKMPFAELWMGCHPSGPSMLLEQPATSLLDWLTTNRNFAGGKSDGLPFLFKVLAVSKPLSIQAHPDAELAKRLHAERPDLYKDPNHKPEMAIALTPFKALCGFRQVSQIAGYCEQLPDHLPAIVGADGFEALRGAVNAYSGSERVKNAIRLAFRNLMHQPESAIRTCIDRLLALDKSTCKLLPLLHEIHADFPGDIGCLSVFFLNLVELQPGEAMFLAANLPHAYLRGDCIECMACSDNVVRAGLTPKPKDVETLLSMLNYEGRSAEACKFAAKEVANGVTSYEPPVPEFRVIRLRAQPAAETERLETPQLPEGSPGILICTSGAGQLADTGRPFAQGTVFLVPAGYRATLLPDANAGVECYLAFAPAP